MKTKYKDSLVLGKFYGFHLGHKKLIDTTIENSEMTHVVVCYNNNQSIGGIDRINMIRETYSEYTNVKFYLFDDGHLPQSDEGIDKDIFYKLWVDVVYGLVQRLDAVFTSESYGDDFAKYLEVEHFLVDINREEFPISGTIVRENPLKSWDYLPESSRRFFLKRIAIMGPESVGKSTLSKKLASYYNTNFVEEYGRTVYENNGNHVSIDDFIKISEGRQKIENEMVKSSNKLIFCDTEDLTTYIFSRMFYPTEYKKVEEWFLDSLRTKRRYELYILLNSDCDEIQDGTRRFLKERTEHYNVIKNEMINRGYDFVEIGGNWDDRFLKSVEIINDRFNI